MTTTMTMTARHEAEVATRFDLLHDRFRKVVEPADVRVQAVLAALSSVRATQKTLPLAQGEWEGVRPDPVRDRPEPPSVPPPRGGKEGMVVALGGIRVLDLGCGKGRFAAHLARAGAEMIGVDLSASMLAEAVGLARVRASARRLPFASGTFDAVVAVEVFEHLAALGPVLAELRRVLRPGGVVAIIDKNLGALNARRPWLPAAGVKWLDERRGRWMYPAGGPVRERWFRPGGLSRRLREGFEGVRVSYLLTPEESRWWVFRRVPRARLLTLWTGRMPGGGS